MEKTIGNFFYTSNIINMSGIYSKLKNILNEYGKIDTDNDYMNDQFINNNMFDSFFTAGNSNDTFHHNLKNYFTSVNPLTIDIGIDQTNTDDKFQFPFTQSSYFKQTVATGVTFTDYDSVVILKTFFEKLSRNIQENPKIEITMEYLNNIDDDSNEELAKYKTLVIGFYTKINTNPREYLDKPLSVFVNMLKYFFYINLLLSYLQRC